MSKMAKIEALKEKHQALEQVLDKLEIKTLPNDLEVASIKKQKLRIKDEIVERSRQ